MTTITMSSNMTTTAPAHAASSPLTLSTATIFPAPPVAPSPMIKISLRDYMERKHKRELESGSSASSPKIRPAPVAAEKVAEKEAEKPIVREDTIAPGYVRKEPAASSTMPNSQERSWEASSSMPNSQKRPREETEQEGPESKRQCQEDQRRESSPARQPLPSPPLGPRLPSRPAAPPSPYYSRSSYRGRNPQRPRWWQVRERETSPSSGPRVAPSAGKGRS
ncbi:hypothetical protein K402DRAFT_450492 [Aulographum hederae CBS 113979]|uniref:Uncharacterized protein n=1 Tax=Aulographum hederae CBS 113979 TaxID=1176131 RepID=A0A6G1HEX3_9PEZI|nr:hypothetical protein K402DRAFT_450492 [Aulographum hederae CBS 113979]